LSNILIVNVMITFQLVSILTVLPPLIPPFKFCYLCLSNVIKYFRQDNLSLSHFSNQTLKTFNQKLLLGAFTLICTSQGTNFLKPLFIFVFFQYIVKPYNSNHVTVYIVLIHNWQFYFPWLAILTQFHVFVTIVWRLRQLIYISN